MGDDRGCQVPTHHLQQTHPPPILQQRPETLWTCIERIPDPTQHFQEIVFDLLSTFESAPSAEHQKHFAFYLLMYLILVFVHLV